jgi:hypothetical protein
LYIDNAPKLRRRILKTAGAFVPGRKTYWQWTGVADAAPLEVTGMGDAVVIEGPEPVRVVITRRGMTCPNPNCRAGCYKLVHNGEGWRCRSCCGLKYRSRTLRHPMTELRLVLQRLARADPGSLSERKLMSKLERVNARIRRLAPRVAFRCTRPARGG